MRRWLLVPLLLLLGAAPAEAAPYVAGGLTPGLGSPWRMTPQNPARFPPVPGPLGADGVALVTTPRSFGPNRQSVMSSLWVMPDVAHAGWADGRRVERQDTWYRVRMLFPSGSYVPTRGQWNWLVEWHDDNRTASFPGAYSIALGVYTDYRGRKGSPGRNPRLALRLMGGRARSPRVRTVELPPGSLLYDHWYDLTFHIVWSADRRVGRVEWWCDGRLELRTRFPTLYTLPSGLHSYNAFGVYNYRLRAPWRSEVRVADAAVGPDGPSVGFPGPQLVPLPALPLGL
jgi:hypothetical protein